MKRLLLGRPLATEEAPHQLLPKRLALPVFASDPLSSNAYATEEILIHLAVAGTASFWLVTPLSLVIGTVVVIVIASYRQTIRAYPRGGGSYMVSSENLGVNFGLVAAAALLTDYTLTVAVSIAAGVAAIISAAPELAEHRVSMALAFVALVMLANLRGVKESGTLFAIPTYLFVLSIWLLLVVGAARCLGGCPQAASAELPIESMQALTFFVILKAFASGSTALTGIEAIADGVPAFRGRRPQDQARNAAATLTVMGGLTLSMFLGLSLLARGTSVHPITEEITHQFGIQEKTVIAQIAETIFGRGFLFFFLQAMTAGILILAANTAYADFPRLSSILARDRFMPRQFMNRGDRLVFSNGVVALSLFAALLIVLFGASVTRLIQLYVVGVFTTFTLSQAGMVRRWRRVRGPRWRANALMNAVGASTTGVVLIVVAVVKFRQGAWIVIAAIPVIIAGFRTIHRHYGSVSLQLRIPEERPPSVLETRALVVVPHMSEATLRAVGYARALRPREIRALHMGTPEDCATFAAQWNQAIGDVPLDLVEVSRDSVSHIRAHARSMRKSEDEVVTVVLPEVLTGSGWRQFLRRRTDLVLKAALLFEPGVVLTDVPTIAVRRVEGSQPAAVQTPIAPARIVAIVLVSGVHNATLRALAYARGLAPNPIGVTFNTDPEESRRIIEEWDRWRVDASLEVMDSPYREVARPLLRYVRELRDARPDTVVSVVLPEFVVRKWWHQFLHNQTALAIKAALLFEPGVVVTSVPFHLR